MKECNPKFGRVKGVTTYYQEFIGSEGLILLDSGAMQVPAIIEVKSATGVWSPYYVDGDSLTIGRDVDLVVINSNETFRAKYIIANCYEDETTWFIGPLPDAPLFDGVIPDIIGTIGEEITPYDASTHFQTGGAPVYYVMSGAPANLVIDQTTGIISGIVSIGGTTNGLVVTAINIAGSAVSNEFSAIINEVVLAPPIFDGVIPDITGDVGVEITPYDASANFQTGGVVVSYALTGAPANIVIDPVTGIISGIGAVEGVTSGLTVTATNGDGLASSTAFTVTIQVTSAFRIMIRTATDLATFSTGFKNLPHDITINWGDGVIEENITTSNPSHEYALAGDYEISVTGATTRLTHLFSDNSAMIISHLEWGSLGIVDWSDAFRGCVNMVNALTVDELTVPITKTGGMYQAVPAPEFNVLNWNMSLCTTISTMFDQCPTLVTPPDVSLWDIPLVTSAAWMFNNMASLTTPPDIAGWDVSSISASFGGDDFLAFTPGVNDTAWLDAVFIAWGAQTVLSGVTFNFGASKYTTGGPAEAGRNLLISQGWTILDGGPVV